MSDIHSLEQMHAICETRHAIRQADFAKLLAEENRLRSELRRLDAMGRDAQTDTLDQVQMQAIGADVIWEGWLGRTKASVNMALARVLAMKEHHLAEVRQAFGKLTVSQQLLKDARAAAAKKVTAKLLSEAIEMSLFRATD